MTKPEIVMIHGMWGHATFWENYRGYFEALGYACRTPALRHHDRPAAAPPHADLGRLSLMDYADDLELYIRQSCGDQRPVVMGHSMGGLLAQQLGVRKLAAALVLITPASPAGINALTFSVLKSFWGIFSRWGFWKRPQRLSFAAARYAILNNLPPEMQRPVYDGLGWESGRAAAEIGFWYLDPNHATEVAAHRMTCPVLVISGGLDRITPARVVEKVYRRYRPVAEYKHFDHHGHWIVQEPGWQQVAADIHRWLEAEREIFGKIE